MPPSLRFFRGCLLSCFLGALIWALLIWLIIPSNGQSQHHNYLPYSRMVLQDCGEITPKKAVAWSHYGSYPFEYRHWCMPDDFAGHWWHVFFPVETDYHMVPFVWSDRDYDHLDKLPADWSGYILTCNEPEIETQADMTPQAAAALMILVHERFPLAKLVSCSHSGEAFVGGPFDWYPGQMWAAYFQQGGQASWIYAAGAHCYNEHLGAVCVDKVRELLPASLQGKPVYVTEAGDCRDDYALALAGFNELFAHPDVLMVHGYTPRSDHECSRWRGLDPNSLLTNAGRAWRDSGKMEDLP